MIEGNFGKMGKLKEVLVNLQKFGKMVKIERHFRTMGIFEDMGKWMKIFEE